MTKIFKSIAGDVTGAEAAAAATERGAATRAAAQQRALDYLQEREAIPQQFREGALGILGGLYGLEGGAEGAVDTLRQSPLYEAIIASRGAGEEAILRQAGATGGLRSGTAQAALADYNIGLEQQALQQALGGIQGLAQLPSNQQQIAQQISGIGQTQAQGIVGGAQARQQGTEQAAQLALTGLAAFSDRALKENIKRTGTENGFATYTWVWNDLAKAALGLVGTGYGVIADEVSKVMPEAVFKIGAFDAVNYQMIGVKHG